MTAVAGSWIAAYYYNIVEIAGSAYRGEHCSSGDPVRGCKDGQGDEKNSKNFEFGT